MDKQERGVGCGKVNSFFAVVIIRHLLTHFCILRCILGSV